MAAERLPMRKLREIIRPKLQAGQSGRAIARSCALSPSTVADYLGRIALAGWPGRCRRSSTTTRRSSGSCSRTSTGPC
jgi:hypothetical protein